MISRNWLAAIAGLCSLAPALAHGQATIPSASGTALQVGPIAAWYNASRPIPAAGQATVLQIDSGGNLYVNCATGCTGSGGGSTPVAPYLQTSRGFQTLAVSSTAVGFTPPTSATYCLIAVETQAIRYRDDGTSPTAGVGGGAPWAVGGQYQLTLKTLSTALFIAQSGTATLDIACYS